MKYFYLLTFCLLALKTTAQNEDNPIIFEKTVNGSVRFYYDKNYFLSPKDCEFKSIERVAAFDAKSSVFNGEFKDFDRNGHVILTGNYINGIKDGEFKAYHPNQILKWEVTFKDNLPTGEWKYYYPDGKPLMVLTYESGRLIIKSFWNQKAQQKITNGNGEYDFVFYFEAFTELGFPSYRRRGKVVDGLPHGLWRLFLIDGKKSELAREEIYKNGVFEDFGEIYYDLDNDEQQLQLYPIDNFIRAELLIFKPCTFDDFSGFINYLNSRLISNFPVLKDYMGNSINEFEYQVILNKKGEPIKTVINKISTESLRPYLLNAISLVNYYLPTYSNGQFVDDTISVIGKLNIDKLGKASILDLSIKRNTE